MHLQETWNEMLNGLWALSKLLMFKCQHLCTRWIWRCHYYWWKFFFTYLYNIFVYSKVRSPLCDTLFSCWGLWWSLYKLTFLNQHFHRPPYWIFLIACNPISHYVGWSIHQLVGPSVTLSIFEVWGQLLHYCSCPNTRLAFSTVASAHLHATWVAMFSALLFRFELNIMTI